jgi:hypothetical protein
MSGPRTITNNPRKLSSLPAMKTDRPTGCSTVVDSSAPEDVFMAAIFGNRATRRAAKRKYRQNVKAWGQAIIAAEGKR